MNLEKMLNDKIKVLVDYFKASECFPGVDIGGGVAIFFPLGEEQ